MFELIQNAVDAGAERISISVRDSALVVQHDNARRVDRGLSDAEVRALCGVCTSSKTQHWSSVGFMGIGFKTLFKLLHTRTGLCFALDAAPPHGLAGSTLPVAVEPRQLDDGFETMFLLSHPLVDVALQPPTALRDPTVAPVFRAVLARRGVCHAKLYHDDQAAGDGAAIKCFSVEFDTTPLWASFCALRQLDPTSSKAPLMRIEAFVSRRARHECWPLLPTQIECPFAFELDAPWMLDIDRQGLRNDHGRGREWNDAIWQHVPSLMAQLCAWLPTSAAAPRALIDVDLVHAQRVWPAALEKTALVNALRSVCFLPIVHDDAFEWLSFDEVGAHVHRWPKSLAWLKADASIPQRHLLLPPMLADDQFNAPSVDLLCRRWGGSRCTVGCAVARVQTSVHSRPLANGARGHC